MEIITGVTTKMESLTALESIIGKTDKCTVENSRKGFAMGKENGVTKKATTTKAISRMIRRMDKGSSNGRTETYTKASLWATLAKAKDK
jgi:hypothetical protein